LEKETVLQIIEVQRQLTHPQAEAMLRRWFVEDKGATDGYLWEDNRIVVEWLEHQLKVKLFGFT
jgi:acetyl-CoA carboxylase/biotin carboxylase 1